MKKMSLKDLFVKSGLLRADWQTIKENEKAGRFICRKCKATFPKNEVIIHRKGGYILCKACEQQDNLKLILIVLAIILGAIYYLYSTGKLASVL